MGGILGSFLILNFTYLCLRPELKGLLFSRLFKFSHKRGFINRESYVAQYLALAILIMGIFVTIGSDDLLASFAAGWQMIFYTWSPDSCVASSPDSDLEAFSHNPAHGSFAPLAFQIGRAHV